MLAREREREIVNDFERSQEKTERYEKPEEIVRKRRDNVKSEAEGNERKISYKIERRKERA